MTAALFTAAVLFGVWGAAPSVSVGDSGEFAAAAATLGVAHPPGYPLYVLAGRAFGTLLPWGTWAWRLNLFSGVCAAGALALLFSACRRRGAGAPAALVAAAVLGLSPLWLHTNAQAEVFALNALLAAACLAVAARPNPMGERSAAALGLLLGLGTANHHTLALAVPALAAGVWSAARPSAPRAARALAVFAVFGVLGASVQLFLPLRAAASPPLDWGHPVDLARFLHVFLRKDYGSLALTVEGSAAAGGAARQLLRWTRELWEGFGPAGTLLAVLGGAMLLSRRERRTESALAAGLALGAGPLFLALGDPPFDPQTAYALKRFWLLSWLGAAGLAAAGAESLAFLLGPARPAALALAFVPAFAAWRAAPSWSQRWDLTAYDHARNLLRSLPPGAALALDGGDDNFYPLAAALYADGRRPDALVFDRGGLVFASPYGPDFRFLSKEAKEGRRASVEAALLGRRPLFYATLRRDILPGAALDPEGLLRRARPGDEPRPTPRGPALWRAYVLRVDPALERAHFRVRALTPFYPVMRATGEAGPDALRRLEAALVQGPDARWTPGAVSEAAQWQGFEALSAGRSKEAGDAYALAARATPQDSGVRSNLGAAFERQGRLGDARREYALAAELSPGDPRPRYNMGVLLYKTADYAAAAAEFTAAAEKPGADPTAAAWAARASARAKAPR